MNTSLSAAAFTAVLTLLAPTLSAQVAHVTVGTPRGYIQTSTSAQDTLGGDSSPLTTVSVGPDDNPFNQSLSAISSTAYATAQSTASQSSSFSSDVFTLDISSIGSVGGATSDDYQQGSAVSETAANSSYSISFTLDEPFTFTLTIGANFQNSSGHGGEAEVELDGPNGVIAFAGIDPSYPGAPSGGTFSGTLPAGGYVLRTLVGVSIANVYPDNSEAASGSYSAVFHAADVAPEPTTSVILIASTAALLATRRRR